MLPARSSSLQGVHIIKIPSRLEDRSGMMRPVGSSSSKEVHVIKLSRRSSQRSQAIRPNDRSRESYVRSSRFFFPKMCN